MRHPPRESTGKGIRTAFVMLLSLFIILIGFYSQVSSVEYITFPYDGDKVGTAFYYRASDPVTRPAPIIIFIHGYNNLKTFDPRVLEFTQRGWDVLAIDLPGHGTNTNEFTTGCWNVIFGALDFVETRPWLWNASAIAVVGHSFGGLVCAMGLLFDSRIAAGVLWAPLLDVASFQPRANEIFPYGHPFNRFKDTDDPFIYIQDGRTLNNTLIIQGTNDVPIKDDETINVCAKLTSNDPSNHTNHSLQLIQGEDHSLYDPIVVKSTIKWLAPYLQPDQAGAIISKVETAPMVFFTDLIFELIALFGLFPGIFIIMVDQIGKRIKRRRWQMDLEAGIENDEYPLATPAINRNWKWHFLFYIVALVFVIFVGVNLFDQYEFHVQLGFMGLLLSGIILLYEICRTLWLRRKAGISKYFVEASDVADNLIDPWVRRMGRITKQITLGILIGTLFLLGMSALTYLFGLFFIFPHSGLNLFFSFFVAFLFNFGTEWLFRRHIQVLINEAAPYKTPRTIKILNDFLILILPFIIAISLFRFSSSITPTIFALFYCVTAICIVANWYIFDATDTIVPTITFSTFVMGWVLAGCLTPAFF